MVASARDRASYFLALLEQAQRVYLLTPLSKKQVLDDPQDALRVRARRLPSG